MKTQGGKINRQSSHEWDRLVAVSLLTVVFFAAKFSPASIVRRRHQDEDLRTPQDARESERERGGGGLKKQKKTEKRFCSTQALNE